MHARCGRSLHDVPSTENIVRDGLTGFLVAIPVFFDVGLIILIPLVYTLVRRTGRSLLYYAIPLVAGA